VPGSGKTTLLNAALADLQHTIYKPSKGEATPAFTAYPGGAQIGYQEGLFGGTDRLPMNIQPRVLDWLQDAPYTRLCAEGDRLCNGAFFSAVIQLGWRLSVVWLHTPLDVAMQRRAARGTRQNRSWVAGRITKIGRLQSWVDAGWILDGALPLEQLADRLRTHPIIRDIRSG
jgi:predicted nucleotide kinase in modified base biosynthesis